ncbi:MAG: glycosyltransferase family 39 protein [Chloroflexi bacterium]|nr:glycosyltransferase family 39 protein [Chloroflexota bacterium]MCL5108179.1 glycosyltransferase family 39 protein [Chloroflexota bacterium]
MLRDGLTLSMRDGHQTSARAASLAGALLVLAAAYAVRLRGLNDWGFWYDEGHSLLVGNKPLPDLFATLANDVHPPLYFLLVRLWQQPFGDSEFALRWLSVLCGTLTVALVWRVAALLVDGKAALLAAVLASTSPLLVYASQEARMYALATFLVCLIACLLTLAWRTNQRLPWLALPAVEAAALYAHYYVALPLAALSLAALLAYVAGGWRHPRRLLAWLCVQVAALALFVPWLPTAVQRLQVYGSDWLPRLTAQELAQRSWLALNLGPWPWDSDLTAPLAAATALTCLALLVGLFERRHRFAVLAAAGWLMLTVVPVIYAALQRPMYHPRYVVQAVPAYCLLLAIGLSRGRRAPLALGLAASAFFIGTGLVGIEHGSVAVRDDARGVAQYIAAHATAKDVVLIDTDPPFRYYGRSWQAPYVILPEEGQNDDQLLARLNKNVPGREYVYHVRWLQSSYDAKELVAHYLRSQTEWLDELTFAGFAVDRYRVDGPTAFRAPVLQPRQSTYVGPVRLVGVALGPGRDLMPAGDAVGVVSGGTLPLALRWRVENSQGKDLAALLTLHDERGVVVGMVGQALINSAHVYSSRWWPNEETTDFYLLNLQAGLPQGDYEIRCILHQVGSAERLDLLDAAGRPLGTEVALGRVRVISPSTASRPQPPRPASRLHDFGPLELVGARLPQGTLRPGEKPLIELTWYAPERPVVDLMVRVALRAAGTGTALVVSQGAPVYGRYATSGWAAGELVTERRELALPPDLAAGEYQVRVSLVGTNGQETEPQTIGSLTLAEPKRSYELPSPQTAVGARLGDAIELLGFDLDSVSLRRDRPLRLTLYWRCLGPVGGNYTAFAHLLGPGDVVWGQHDSPPLDGGRPTAGWAKGEVLTDVYDLSLRPGAPAGTYQIEVGLYDPKTMERLPVSVSETAPADNRAILATLELRE